MWHIQKDWKQMKNGDGKGKEKNFVYIMESVGYDALILFCNDLKVHAPATVWMRTLESHYITQADNNIET